MKNLFKKTSTIVLAISVALCSIAFPTFAAESSNLEEAILNAKSKIEIPSSLSEFDSNIYTSDEGTYYNLTWNDEDNNTRIEITVNDKGDIYSYYSSDRGKRDSSIRFSTYSGEELKNKAIDWLIRVNPDWVAELDIDNADTSGYDSIYSDSVYIRFRRIKNGIEFLGNSVSITLSNRTGETLSMHSNWSYDDKIPATSDAIGTSAAGDEFFKLSPLELRYENIDGLAKLVYVPTQPYIRINARQGGEIVDEYDYLSKNESVTEDTMASGSNTSADRLTESELANIDEIDGLLSEASLEEIAKSLKNTGLDAAEYTGISYARGYGYYPKSGDKEKEDYFASLNFIFNPKSENEYRGTVTLNAKTGELIRFYSYNWSEVKESKVGADEAKKSAETFIAEYSPDQHKKVKASATDEEVYSDYNLSFVRYENDIPYYANSISVGVSAETGHITSFSKNWDNEITFENSEGIIDMEAAENNFRSNIGFELSYVYDYSQDTKKVELCYAAADKGSFMIDAHTGELTEIYKEDNRIMPTDISGHYAEKQILTLVDVGIIEIVDNNTLYRPDDIITKGELGHLVSRLSYQYYPYDAATAEKMMRNLSILIPEENFNADAAALREDGAVYIVRAAGYRDIAEISGIFNCTFNDADKIPAEKIGYISIAKGIGIVKGDENGCFNAGDSLTRADAAIMIYNYLAR